MNLTLDLRSLRCTALLCAAPLMLGLLAAPRSGAEPDYEAALWDPIHFKPAIQKAKDEQCLACHQDVLGRQVLEQAPAGLEASGSLAWYQTLDTYSGDQETFHRRHAVTPLARSLMNLRCNFCHQGHDPREEAPGSSATSAEVGGDAGFTLRKTVDPAETCLLCHGTFPYEVMDGVDGPWHEVRLLIEDEETPNGCLGCHEELFRTVRHQVNYLNAEAIEDAAKESSDSCYGCHGGRAWFAIPYPYARTPWPDMPEEVPEWAKDRPTASDARFLIGVQRGAELDQ